MMVFAKLIKKYHTYEDKETERRAERINKAKPYKSLARKTKAKKVLKNMKKNVGTFDKTRYTKSLGNPYSVKFPKAKKVLKTAKKKKFKSKRKVIKVVTIYKK